MFLFRHALRNGRTLSLLGLRLCMPLLVLLGALSPVLTPKVQAQEKFEEYEIRVIRPRYFQKRGRFELGAQMAAITNETFVYTLLATGIITYHFSETLAVEGSAALGYSIDKEDKRILFEEFDIRTQIFRTLYQFEGALLWTPVYGKWQLTSGRLIYFDTYLAAGGGMTGIEWKYSDFCAKPTGTAAATAPEIPADTTKSYPTFMLGLGQRFFLKKDMAVKWDIRNHSLMYNTIDAECNPSGAAGKSDLHNSITMQFGASKFF